MSRTIVAALTAALVALPMTVTAGQDGKIAPMIPVRSAQGIGLGASAIAPGALAAIGRIGISAIVIGRGSSNGTN